jgi:hypothetical protein
MLGHLTFSTREKIDVGFEPVFMSFQRISFGRLALSYGDRSWREVRAGEGKQEADEAEEAKEAEEAEEAEDRRAPARPEFGPLVARLACRKILARVGQESKGLVQ